MPYTHKIPPYKHQSDALETSWNKDQFALLMEMGTGKTKVAIDTICRLYLDGKIKGALIIAPKGVYMNWVNKELPQHLSPDVEKVLVVPWSGAKTRKQREELDKIRKPGDRLNIFVMNVEALSSGHDAINLAWDFLEAMECIMVVDESTTIKNHSAKRTKAVLNLGRRAKYRRIMTGMPVTRSPLDIYSQFEFLRPGLLGFSSFYTFRSRYAIVDIKHFGPRSVKVVTGYQNETDLQSRILPHSFRVLKDDCLDLPPKVYSSRIVELTSEQKRIYQSILENATAELETKDHVTATEVIVQLLRLHQVICGHVVDESGVTHDLPENRTKALCEIIEESEGSMIIWCSYRHDIKKVIKAIEPYGGAVEYHGGVDEEGRAMAIRKFQDGEARFFVATQHTGGYGLTLTTARNVVYYSNTHNLELRAQSEDRAHRIGQKASSVLYTDLLCEGTVDEKIIQSLRNKIDLATAVTGDKYKEWLI